jgi:quercetin dioxygenase-like cupin family protein
MPTCVTLASWHRDPLRSGGLGRTHDQLPPRRLLVGDLSPEEEHYVGLVRHGLPAASVTTPNSKRKHNRPDCRPRKDMEKLTKRNTAKGPAEKFTGDVWYDVIAESPEHSVMRVNVVRFAPGARSAWHAHARGQTLYVIEGVGRIQSRGGDVIEIRSGDVVYTPPGEWHWHGATADDFMTHLAMWEEPEHGPAAEWGEHVTDAGHTGTRD